MKLLISLVSILLVCGLASANDEEKAEALFKKGQKLMAEKHYADACGAFEESFTADPALGAKLLIAKCYEEWGKIGRALLAYQQAEKMADEASDKRLEKIRERVASLDPQVPRLTIKIPKDTSTKQLKVTLDNQTIETFNEPRIVDPGPHTLEWSVAGGPKRNRVVPVDRGGDPEITIELPKTEVTPAKTGNKAGNQVDKVDKGGTAARPKKEPADVRPARGRTQRIGGLVLGSGGVIAIGVSAVMTLSARGQYNDALATHCNGMKDSCDPTGLELTADARATANLATIVFIGGIAMVGGGVALYLLAPNGERERSDGHARYIVPSVTAEGGGVVFGGRF